VSPDIGGDFLELFGVVRPMGVMALIPALFSFVD
jgi:hypothetical protein